MGLSSSERQARYREAQKLAGRKARNLWLSEEEADLIDRLLFHLREYGEKPAQVRDKRGRFRPFEY